MSVVDQYTRLLLTGIPAVRRLCSLRRFADTHLVSSKCFPLVSCGTPLAWFTRDLLATVAQFAHRGSRMTESELTEKQESRPPAASRRPILRQKAPPAHTNLTLRRTFYPLGYPVEIRTNESSVLDSAQESFGHGHFSRGQISLSVGIEVSPAKRVRPLLPEPLRRQYDHLCSLTIDADNQALLDLRSCTGFIWVTDATTRDRLSFRRNFLEKTVYLLLGASVVTDIHAACVSNNGKGILLCGNSGAGKSTLSYACARAGWTYTSDDTCYLINDSIPPRVIGHAHRARFRPAARNLFPELRRHELTPYLEGKPSIEVPINTLPVKNIAAEARVDAVVYLNRLSYTSAKLTPLPKGAAATRTCEELHSVGEIRAKHVHSLRALSHIPAFELRYSSLADGITLLGSLTRSL
jgi:hypothetical protein